MKMKYVNQLAKLMSIQMLEVGMASMGYGEGFPTYSGEEIMKDMIDPQGLPCVDYSGFKMVDDNGVVFGFLNSAFVNRNPFTMSAGVILIYDNKPVAGAIMSYPPLTSTGGKAFRAFKDHIVKNLLSLDDDDGAISEFVRKVGPFICNEVPVVQQEIKTTTKEI